MKLDTTRLLMAVLAVSLALRASLGEAPFPPDVAAYIGWVLNGLAAGLTAFLSPQVATAIRAMFAPPGSGGVSSTGAISNRPTTP